MALTVWGVGQYICSLPDDSRVTGGFDNPAGFAITLCCGFPFALLLVRHPVRTIRYVGYAACVGLCLGVIVSGSRAGILALMVVCGVRSLAALRNRPRLKWTLVLVAFALLAGLYYLKQDSANGRLLVWRCSLQMVADHPVVGFGPGGFVANYMEYLADYFREHPDSSYALLADSVHHPFNEYLLIIIQYGLAGFLAFVFLVGITIRQYCNQRAAVDPLSKAAGMCLLSIGVFALFSYPGYYPSTWLMILFCVWVIWGYPLPGVRAIRVLIMGLSVVLCGYAIRDMLYRSEWYRFASKAGFVSRQIHPQDHLVRYFDHDRAALYDYAYYLFQHRQYETCSTMLRRYQQTLNDYDVQLMQGECCRMLNRLQEAEEYYLEAASMCPNRFIPLYRLVEIYDQTNRPNDALRLARVIVSKPVKIPSGMVSAIQRRMRQRIGAE